MYEAIEVVTAASPTKEWNPATVWGRAVTSTLCPRIPPAVPPIAIRAKA